MVVVRERLIRRKRESDEGCDCSSNLVSFVTHSTALVDGSKPQNILIVSPST